MKTTAIFFFALIATAMTIDLPNNFKICKRSDPKMLQCITDATRETIIFIAKGLKSFEILPLEPLSINKVKIDKFIGPVSLKQEYRDVKIHGLTKGVQVYNYKINWDNLIFKFDVMFPKLDAIGDYTLDGRILLLPISGNGSSKLSFHDVIVKSEIHFEKFEKNGETYMKVKKYILKTSTKLMEVQFDNLFNGNAILGEQMNKILNANNEYLYGEFQESYEEVFASAYTRICNSIFGRVPLSKIFPLK